MAAAIDRSYRVLLPTDVVPKHYDLTLEPDLDRFVFDGRVSITCNVEVATETIVVHQKELTIASAIFTPLGGKALVAEAITTRAKAMTATFVFDEILPTGEGVLEIVFRGCLNDKMAGFYRSKYTDSQGKTKHMGVTQFEAIDARRAFPCWDEPAVKATFAFSMVYAQDLTAISNMPQSRCEILSDGRKKESFITTPKMSTYLLAFCVGEFEFVSATTKDGVLCRVFAPPGRLSKCEFGLRTCVQALEFYNEFFGIPYPLPKMDMISIPDFSAGAMENWGLVTYREVLLLCDEATVSSAQKQLICQVVAHELAHQWFGNLVTMEWWDDLWLNEGFANWGQTFCTDQLHPEWKIWQTYVKESQQNALKLDSLRSSHPIQVPLDRAEKVWEVFDAISYCKGGSVVRMIYAVLGAKAFQDGLRMYFKKHQYSNTLTADLWAAWSEASGKPISKMMSSWTSQMGFPVLRVLNDPLAEGSDEVELEQSWFLADGSVEPDDESHSWIVPVFAGSDSRLDAAEPVFLTEKRQRLPLHGASSGGAKWLKLNFGQHVLCRVLYPASMIERLASSVSHLPVEDRIGLLSDTFALGKSGALDLESLGKLLSGFAGESNDKVWFVLNSVLSSLGDAVASLDQTVVVAFRGFAAKLLSPAFGAVGWDAEGGDDDNRKQLRSLLVGGVARFCHQDSGIAAEALKRAEAFLVDPTNPKSLSPDICGAVLSIAMKQEGCHELYDRLVKAHNAVADNAVKKDICMALGGCESSELRKRCLEWNFCEDVRAQDMMFIPTAVAQSGKAGAEEVFDWIKADCDRLSARQSTMLFQRFVGISGMGFASEEKAAELKAFWEKRPEYDTVAKNVNQTVENVITDSKFVERLKLSAVGTKEFWENAATSL